MTQTFPLVTVVTVTYNAQEHLEQTIQSVIEQDYPSIEYIIIDGGSEDDSIDIIRKHEQYIHYWVSEQDSGIYDAMNKAIEVASGEWINFMNAGDSFVSSKTVSIVSENFDNHIDLLLGDINYVDKEKSTYLPAKGLEYAFDGMFCYHQSLFTRSTVMKEYLFDTSFKISGDYDFVLRCYVNNKTFKFLPTSLANFISDGAAESNKIRARIEDLYIQSRYLESIDYIFQSGSYAKLISYQRDNNRLMGILLNKLYANFDKLKLSDKNFVLYGFGHIGKIIYSRFRKNIISIVDINHISLNENSPITISPPESLSKKNKDYILISVLGREQEIKMNLLKSYKFSEDRILTFSL